MENCFSIERFERFERYEIYNRIGIIEMPKIMNIFSNFIKLDNRRES